jgi:catechol 2,3-dioxygenase-like lactoylglutathione lyase family enzyme
MASDGAMPARDLSAIVGFRLVTAELGRLTTFYRDVLGGVADGPEQAISLAELRLLGLGGRGRRQTMRLGAQAVAIEQFDPPGRPYPVGGDAACLWFQHLAVVVGDMALAYQRVRGASAISTDGPQTLPVSAGHVRAYKFRDPDGHPLELLAFPDDAGPPAWRSLSAGTAGIGAGIDHSAISVADVASSIAFYEALGLRQGAQTLNHGPTQQCLDNLPDVSVTVTPMHAWEATPHLELLGYRTPRGAAGPLLRANDVAATRIVWRGREPALLRDPDGHFQQIEPARADAPR